MNYWATQINKRNKYQTDISSPPDLQFQESFSNRHMQTILVIMEYRWTFRIPNTYSTKRDAYCRTYVHKKKGASDFEAYSMITLCFEGQSLEWWDNYLSSTLRNKIINFTKIVEEPRTSRIINKTSILDGLNTFVYTVGYHFIENPNIHNKKQTINIKTMLLQVGKSSLSQVFPLFF